MPPEMPTPTVSPTIDTTPGGTERGSQTPSVGARYVWVLLVGVLGYLCISAVLLSAYVLTEGRGFFIPMKWPTLAFIQLFGAPTLLAGFLPFVGAHMIASALRMRITTRSAAIAGGVLGAMGAWGICGRQGCFGPFGTYPILGWYIIACCFFSALFYQKNASKHGF